MVDGFNIAQQIFKKRRDLYDLLSEIEVTGQYLGDGVFLKLNDQFLN